MGEMTTEQQFERIIAECREIFTLKMKDYGPSWRIWRLQTVNDQLFIKAKRIREIETTGVNLVGDSIKNELMGIVNYSIIGLIQMEIPSGMSVDMTRERALELYDKYALQARRLMLSKNHDYGEAWREMETSSYTDLILAKILRNKSIVANDGKTLVSEGTDGNYFDMVNYAIFGLIRIDEES